MKTKFGNAKINNRGYYVITSKKEGNNGKLLHRLVFEDYHNCTLDSNDAIHHADFNKLNNHPNNLICMSKKGHSILHNTHNKYNQGNTHSEETKKKMSETRNGKKLSEEHKINISESKNTSGYYRVYKRKNKRYKQGFQWIYKYYDENSKQKYITSVDINKLEQKVKTKGLPWRKIL